ncbi:MAG TPA: hypothetical protein VMJ32_00640 [Pirellulales bacterium]|nr:hypothetical protein [Pirellulales bacterium]
MTNYFISIRIGYWARLMRMPLMIACLAMFSMLGCNREPAISKADVKVVGELKTAIGAKKSDWLEAAGKNLDANRQQGKATDDEYAALESIVADARAGHWDEANSQLTRLITAQHAP